MKSILFERFAIQNKKTGDLVRGKDTSSPQTYRTKEVAERAMGARGWSFQMALEHEVVPVSITVGAHKK